MNIQIHHLIKNLTNVILNNNITHRQKFKETFNKVLSDGEYWNNNCTTNYLVTGTCAIIDEPDLFPLPVLTRMLANTEIYKCLNIQDIDPFYKKYIKYKLKYLNEKK